jgi:hypothetical protein
LEVEVDVDGWVGLRLALLYLFAYLSIVNRKMEVYEQVTVEEV